MTTRNARSGLPAGIHWRGLDVQVHLGYRKGTRGGVWLVRWRNGAGYKQAAIGTADDVLKEETLDYAAACKAARELVDAARREVKAIANGPPLTVGAVLNTYVAKRDARDSLRKGRTVRSDASQRLGRYVTGQGRRGKQEAVPAAPIAAVPLHMLREADLLEWRDGLPKGIKATTRQRLVNDLKAALNDAYAANRERMDAMLPSVIKHGLRAMDHRADAEPIARENQILSDAEIGRLLRAARDIDAEQNWGGDLFRLILVLAATGARFSQVARIRVGDCQIAAGRLLVPVSRKGRGARSGTQTVPIGRDVVEILEPVVAGRPAGDVLLQRWRSVQKRGSVHWERDRRGAWQSSREFARPWQAIRDKANMPQVIPYAFRHSSIVKGIRANLPIRLVAALHDTSTAMIERHYAAWITDGLEDIARTAIVPLVVRE